MTPKMNPPTLEEVSLELIIEGGNARGFVHEALKAAREGLFDEADKKMKQAEEAVHNGHRAQTSLLQSEGEGPQARADLLFVHAHGHLMTAMSEMNMAQEMIHLYKKLKRDFLHFGG